jgi:integrase
MQVGNQVSKETATKICDCLNVAFNKYYGITVIEVPYSLASNNGVKTFVHSVLHEAVIQGLISCNYISNTYVKPVTGTKKEKEILNDNDFNEYMKALNKETDLRKKAAFACFLYLGLRTAEVAGLSWANIDLENQEVSIKQNTIYVVGFGTITKDPKSKNSNRVICMPTDLCDILQQYKVWWDNEKDNHGDLWANTDKLFVQQNGNDMCGSTLSMWLGNWQKKYGLKRVTPHAIRHSVITLLIANNVDVKTVSARAGHSDVQTTLNIYTHYTKEADRQAANKIDTLLKIKND